MAPIEGKFETAHEVTEFRVESHSLKTIALGDKTNAHIWAERFNLPACVILEEKAGDALKVKFGNDHEIHIAPLSREFEIQGDKPLVIKSPIGTLSLRKIQE